MNDEKDDLLPAEGIINAVMFSLLLWAVVAVVIWIATR